MSNTYKDNTEPKVGDRVMFASGDMPEVYKIISVQGGRLGNKVGVVPENDPDGCAREYYYYCFVKA